MRVLLSRMLAVLRRRRDDSNLDDEIRSHLDLLTAEHERRGLSPRAARDAARRDFGGVEPMKEVYRDQRGLPWVDAVWQDVRYAFRSLHRTPTVTVAAVVTFALGIGANTAVFSVVDAVLLRPLVYTEPERLVVLHETVPKMGRVPVGAAEFEQWRKSSRSFEQMALIAVAPVILTGVSEPERLDAARVSATLFPMLGINPALGRTFSADEEVTGRHRVVVLSDDLWRARFGADKSIVGRTISLNDESYVVTGVLPAHFRFPRLEQLFVMGITGGRPQLWDAVRHNRSRARREQLRRPSQTQRRRVSGAGSSRSQHDSERVREADPERAEDRN